MAEQKLCVTYYKNVEQRRKILRSMFAEIMLAIKFKVRFYNRFRSNYGADHDTRLQKYW